MKNKYLLLSSSIILALTLAACSDKEETTEEVVVEESTTETTDENTTDMATQTANFEVDTASETYFDETTYPALEAATTSFDSIWQEYWEATFLGQTDASTTDDLIATLKEGEAALKESISQFETIPVDNLPTEAQEGINKFAEKFIDSTNTRVETFAFVSGSLEDGKKLEELSTEAQQMILDSNLPIEEAYTILNPILSAFGYEI